MAVPLLRTLILYCAVICAVRLWGNGQIGELDPSELVVTILVSDLAAVPMQDLGIPLLSGLVPIATLVVLEIFLSFAALKSRRFRRLLNGQPAIIIRRGQLDIGKLRQMRLTTDEVIETLRKQNVAAVSDVKYGVIEPDGTLTVILKQPAAAGHGRNARHYAQGYRSAARCRVGRPRWFRARSSCCTSPLRISSGG